MKTKRSTFWQNSFLHTPIILSTPSICSNIIN